MNNRLWNRNYYHNTIIIINTDLQSLLSSNHIRTVINYIIISSSDIESMQFLCWLLNNKQNDNTLSSSRYHHYHHAHHYHVIISWMMLWIISQIWQFHYICIYAMTVDKSMAIITFEELWSIFPLWFNHPSSIYHMPSRWSSLTSYIIASSIDCGWWSWNESSPLS